MDPYRATEVRPQVVPIVKALNSAKTIPANNSLERTQPQRGFMYDVALLRRSARGRYPELGAAGLYEITAGPGQVRFRRKPAGSGFEPPVCL